MKDYFDTNLEVFLNLLKDQFTYGAQKYAGSKSQEKESTDFLFEDFTPAWLYGTCAKYVERYTNIQALHGQGRERDLLKIATYMYITWLKRGYHIHLDGTQEIINTNIKNKADNWTKFTVRVKAKFAQLVEQAGPNSTDDYDIKQCYALFANWVGQDFSTLPECELVDIVLAMFFEWDKHFATKAGQDADTFNEGKSDG